MYTKVGITTWKSKKSSRWKIEKEKPVAIIIMTKDEDNKRMLKGEQNLTNKA